MTCALKESSSSSSWSQTADSGAECREGAVSYLRHPLQDDGAGGGWREVDETTALVLGSALATINQPSFLFLFFPLNLFNRAIHRIK